MASLNKVMLIGNLGRDPETRTTPSGQKVSNFSIATSERFQDKSGQRQERTEWHNIVVWGRQAEFVERYLRKGISIFVEGKLQTRSWDDQATGKKQYRTEVQANNITILTPKAQGASGAGAPDSYDDSDAAGYGSGGSRAPSAPGGGYPSQPAAPVDDDLPF